MGRRFLLLLATLTIQTTTYSQEGIYDLMDRYIKEGEFEEVVYLTSTLAFEDDRWKLYKAKALLGMGEIENAETLIQDYMKTHPKDESALLLLARIELDKGNYEEALRILRKAKESQERNFLLGMAYHNLGVKEVADVYLNMSSEDEVFGAQVRNLRRVTPKINALLNLSVGYDSNPTIAPQQGGISRQESIAYRSRGFLNYDDGVNKVWISAGYTKYEEKVKDFDTIKVSAGAKRLFGRLQVPVTVDIIYLGGRFYRGAGFVGLGYYMDNLSLTGYAGYQDYTNRDTPEEDNRDGANLYLEGKYHFPKKNMAIDFTLRMGYEDTKGKNWKNTYIYPLASVDYRSGDITLGFRAGAGYYRFLNKDSNYGVKREDLFLTANPYVRYFLTDYLYAEVSYTFSNNRSNIENYQYLRNEVYGSVGGVF